VFHYTGVFVFLKYDHYCLRNIKESLPICQILSCSSSNIIYVLFILDCVVCGMINIELPAIMLTDFSTFQIQVFAYLNRECIFLSHTQRIYFKS